MSTAKFVEEDGVFRNVRTACSCCHLKLHDYLFPLNRKTGSRNLATCISCSRDCRGVKGCNLGRLWGCALCKEDATDSPHPTTGHGGTQYLLTRT